MASGPMRERLTLQALTETDDGMGGFGKAWADVETVWGRTWGATGQERTIAAMTQASVARHFAIRYYASLTTKHRVVYEGQTYNITFVNHMQHRGLTYFDGTDLSSGSAG